jgi:hypothetical protein
MARRTRGAPNSCYPRERGRRGGAGAAGAAGAATLKGLTERVPPAGLGTPAAPAARISGRMRGDGMRRAFSPRLRAKGQVRMQWPCAHQPPSPSASPIDCNPGRPTCMGASTPRASSSSWYTAAPLGPSTGLPWWHSSSGRHVTLLRTLATCASRDQGARGPGSYPRRGGASASLLRLNASTHQPRGRRNVGAYSAGPGLQGTCQVKNKPLALCTGGGSQVPPPPGRSCRLPARRRPGPTPLPWRRARRRRR